jgi:hypothetical protein
VITSPRSSLLNCFAAIGDNADPAAFARCEEEHFGTEWRRQPHAEAGAGLGWLPPEIIQAVVRAKFPLFRRCNEGGLRRDPHLSGRVVTKFIIDVDGTVSAAMPYSSSHLRMDAGAGAGPDMSDESTVQCLLRSFAMLRFPNPERGKVTVVYPLIFNPGD